MELIWYCIQAGVGGFGFGVQRARCCATVLLKQVLLHCRDFGVVQKSWPGGEVSNAHANKGAHAMKVLHLEYKAECAIYHSSQVIWYLESCAELEGEQ